MILYVVGPVTGRGRLNEPAFRRAASALEAAGFSAVIPHETVPSSADWRTAMRESIYAMLGCDGVARLPDWRSSKGARIESMLAKQIGMPVRGVAEWCKEEAE